LIRLVLAILVAATAGAAAASPRPETSALARLAGQTIMTGVAGRTPSASLLDRIRAGQVGGVIIFRSNIAGPEQLARLLARLQSAAAAGGNPPLLVAVDQGGAVKRLPDGPPDLSPAAMGLGGSAAEAGAEGARTAAYLRGLGIDVDLAPVLDTPASASSFLGSRAFSRDPRLNARLGTAFVRGLQRAGVAATAKHFPGLGTAATTTDRNNAVLTTPARVLDARLLPFEHAVGTGVDLVMVSNAGYTAYDPTGAPAVLSRPIVTGLLRGSLGFRGVVITDEMEAPGPSSRPGAAIDALSAGDDILLYTNEVDSAIAYAQVVGAVTSGALSVGVLQASATRIEALKRRLARA
jgi:beta-N-acetylhexosaminidase